MEQNLPMTRFEPRISGAGSDWSTNYAITTFLQFELFARANGMKIVLILTHLLTNHPLNNDVVLTIKAEVNVMKLQQLF